MRLEAKDSIQETPSKRRTILKGIGAPIYGFVKYSLFNNDNYMRGDGPFKEHRN
jgi:hypothetical protein